MSPVRGREGGRQLPLRSVRRALAVLRAFESPPHLQGITDLSRSLGLSKGTVHLLVGVLEGEGFLERDPASGKYQLGSAVHRLTAAAERDLRTMARESLRRLYTDTSFPAYLAVLVGGQAVIVEKAAPTLSFLSVLDVGAPVPFHCSALGKALLAHLGLERREELVTRLGREGLPRMTQSTLTSLDELRAELERVAREGVAVDQEESLPGVVCFGAPVWNAAGEVAAAVSVAAPAASVAGPRQRAATIEILRRAAEAISYRLGWREPGSSAAAGAPRSPRGTTD